jgi:putative ABC transport system permease protein
VRWNGRNRSLQVYHRALAGELDAGMTKTGFIFANLFRRKARTMLTLLSVTCAFLLFGLLQAVNVLLRADVSFVGATRLIVQARVSMAQPLPMRMLPQLQAVPGVQAVTQLLWFGGVMGENTPIAAFAVDPEGLPRVSPQWVMPEEQWRAFAKTRTGAIAGRLMAQQQGWKIGSKIPIKSNIFPQKNGSKDWTFDLVGIFDGRDAAAQKQTSRVYLNHAYVDEANQFGSGNAGVFVLRLADPDQAQSIAQTVDRMFENSPDETKTQTEQDFVLAFVKQIGDIGMIVRWILFAVFFTLLLVVGNTMAQSVRERIPELAVLKTLGFSNESVLGFVLAEAAILCGLGGLVGMALATLAGFAVESATSVPLAVDYRVWGAGMVAIVLLSLAVGLLPALRARRLSIVDALAGR